MVSKNHKLFWKIENYGIQKNYGPSATLTHRGKKKRDRMKMLYKGQFRDLLETEKDTINVKMIDICK